MSLLSDGKSYSITLTNNSGVLYKERLTNNSVQIGDTLIFQVTGTALKDSIMSNAAQHNVLRGRTEIVANAVALGGSSGGTADYPSFTGNANKVLAVKATEDGVEWKTVTGGGGSASGGINVIEYDPSLHEVVTDTVVSADFEPTRPNTNDDIPTSSWNPTTGVMGVASAAQTLGFPNNYAKYVGLRLTPSLYGMRGSFTIDTSLCEDAWGFALLQREHQSGFPIDLWDYLTNQHYKTAEDTGLSQPNTFGMFLNEDDTYGNRSWVTEVFSDEYKLMTSGSYTTKPQGVYTFTVGGIIDYLIVAAGFTYEQAVAYITVNFPNNAASIMARTVVFNADLEIMLDVKANTPYLHFFMNAYHKASETGTHLLDPTSQLTITYNLETVENTVPDEAVDGDFLHLLGNAKLLGKELASGDFVQLYDNTSKMIVHADQP